MGKDLATDLKAKLKKTRFEIASLEGIKERARKKNNKGETHYKDSNDLEGKNLGLSYKVTQGPALDQLMPKVGSKIKELRKEESRLKKEVGTYSSIDELRERSKEIFAEESEKEGK